MSEEYKSYKVTWSVVVDAPDIKSAAVLGLTWLREDVEDGNVNLEVVDRETSGEREFVRFTGDE